jgi:transcriptional regulator with XRE-family HTH domain
MKNTPHKVPNLGKKILKLRQAKALTQEQMAILLGLSQTAYGKIERGESSASWKRIYQISEIFNIKPMDWLWEGDEDKNDKQTLAENERKLYEEQIMLLREQISYQKDEISRLTELLNQKSNYTKTN